MQVTNSQPSFGGAKYSLNVHTDQPSIMTGVRSEVDDMGQKYDIKLKLKGRYNCTGGQDCCPDYLTTSKVTVSKKDKTRFEKVLHFFGFLPHATVKSSLTQGECIGSACTAEQAIGDAKKAVKKFETKTSV